MFDGYATTEPITLAAKFTNISSEMTLEETDKENKSILSKLDNSILIDEIQTSLQIPENSNQSFNIGIIVGLIVGIALGSIFFFIIRQK